jgi:amino acid transporter
MESDPPLPANPAPESKTPQPDSGKALENAYENFEASEVEAAKEADGLGDKVKRTLFGAPKSLQDPRVFHSISLIAFLAWVGLGADGLSSSAYGPDESFRALGTHTYLALGLALATAFTVIIISYAYSRVIEHFPFGGGGYVVASRLLGPKFGVISGSALLVDYVLTIAVSIAAGADQVFSVLPQSYHKFKLVIVCLVIVVLTGLNLRGVKESVKILMPIFLVFLAAHAVLIIGGISTHAMEAGPVIQEVKTGFHTDWVSLGFVGMFAIFIRAYTMGAGTYTGIEAVSNGLSIMREPKVETGKKTMVLMAISLAVTAGGILVCYLLFHVTPTAGKTMNAVLVENFASNWVVVGLPIGHWFVLITLGSEALLLFVAAQAGFIDGPRVMANMANDSWMPHRFNSLSDRLTMQNGVLIICVASILILLYTGGDTTTLVLMYSINVFLTFSLSETGMVRYWFKNRAKYPKWYRSIFIHIIGLILCVSILIVNVREKFTEGGWITLLITTALILLCLAIKQHYVRVKEHLKRLDDILDNIPVATKDAIPAIVKNQPTAVILVGGYGGLGIHTVLNIVKLFPQHFKNYVYVSVGVIDSVKLKGVEEVDEIRAETKEALERYVDLTQRLGMASDFRMSIGTEVVAEAVKVCDELAKEFPKAVFFASKLVFQKERWFQRILHNETAYQIQRRLQFDGHTVMVLPVRVFSTKVENKLKPGSLFAKQD